MVVAVIGLTINLLSAWLLAGASEHHHNHDHNHDYGHGDQLHHVTCRDNNLRAALVHVLADVATSVAAIIGLAAAWIMGWHWLDPAIALVASVVVLRWALGLLRQTGSILLDAEGPECLRSQVRQRLESAGSNRVVDMHLWSVGQGKWTLVVSVVSHGSASPESLKAHIEDLSWICHPIIEVYRCDACDIQSMSDQN
jgi:cation diffusion facilitator family transporter